MNPGGYGVIFLHDMEQDGTIPALQGATFSPKELNGEKASRQIMGILQYLQDQHPDDQA